MNIPIHPDDILLFQEVSKVARQVARHYELPLRSIEGFPMPKKDMADWMGDCSHTGVIRIVLRCTVDGEWCDAPLSPPEVWDTVAHELAHLRYMDHGEEFWKFQVELKQAVSNKKVDHRDKVLERLVKLQNSREGEARLGNTEAAESFAAAINKMLIENELEPSAIDYARSMDHDPVIEMKVNWAQHMRPGDDPKKFQPGKKRIAWQESLARIVSRAHLCQFLISGHSDTIWFVGTKSHATVAEYVYTTLVLATYDMVTEATNIYKRRCKREGSPEKAIGFRDSWLSAFILRIAERFEDARKAAVTHAAVDVPGGETQALMRLSGALTKAQKYIDDKFRAGHHSLAALQGPRGYNNDGRQAGRAAADKMAIGRRGVNPSSVKGYIG